MLTRFLGEIEPRNCLVLVFNKKNKEALVNKLEPEWKNSISTIHSTGYRTLRNYLNARRLNVHEYKYRQIAKTLDWFNGSHPKKERICSLANFLKLGEFIRLTQSPLNFDSLASLVDHYALDINKKHLDSIGERITYVFQRGWELAFNEFLIDHTDMIWLPVAWRINHLASARKFARVMIDEAQDLSALQLEFICGLTTYQSKSVFVGDPFQSINGFCGADTNSFSRIKHKTGGIEVVLPICYRCPKTHIQLINQLYPKIPITPRDNATEGIVKVIREGELWDRKSDTGLRNGDLLIARCSASLVDLHLKMVIRGIPCNLVGSSLKQDLLDLIEAVADLPGFEYAKFTEFSSSYLKSKVESYKDNDNKAILQLQLEDSIKAVLTIYNHFSQCLSTKDLGERIDLLFVAQNKDGVALSTVHRAKGLEAERVYIADPVTIPLIWDNQKDWQKQQEDNLLYVALSRSTHSLFLIGEASWYDRRKNPAQGKFDSEPVTDPKLQAAGLSGVIEKISDGKLDRLNQLILNEQGKRISNRFQALLEGE